MEYDFDRLNEISKKLYGYNYNSVNVIDLQKAIVRKKYEEEIKKNRKND